MSYQRRFVTCSRCQGTGRLPLGKGDFLECPVCDGAGRDEVITERIQAPTQERFIPAHGGGLTKHTKILLPHGQGWSDPNGSI